jgi:hypothetical protein
MLAQFLLTQSPSPAQLKPHNKRGTNSVIGYFLLSERFTPSPQCPLAVKLFLETPRNWHLYDYSEVTRYKHFIMATVEKPKERPSALRSIIAGSTAGAVEIGM